MSFPMLYCGRCFAAPGLWMDWGAFHAFHPHFNSWSPVEPQNVTPRQFDQQGMYTEVLYAIICFNCLLRSLVTTSSFQDLALILLYSKPYHTQSWPVIIGWFGISRAEASQGTAVPATASEPQVALQDMGNPNVSSEEYQKNMDKQL